jgi:hypothetical protein
MCGSHIHINYTISKASNSIFSVSSLPPDSERWPFHFSTNKTTKTQPFCIAREQSSKRVGFSAEVPNDNEKLAQGKESDNTIWHKDAFLDVVAIDIDAVSSLLHPVRKDTQQKIP